MDAKAFHRAIYLTGPTASGKTAVGVALARRLDAEVVAMDSTTIYRRMDIGTAKPTMAERGGIPHHLIDVIEPWESASVADYRGWAREAVRGDRGPGPAGAVRRRDAAVPEGACCAGLFAGPGSDPELRRRLEEEAEARGDAALHARLAALDPATAARLHPNDRRRVVRALEVIAMTGRPLSELQVEHHRAGAGVGLGPCARAAPRPPLRTDRPPRAGLLRRGTGRGGPSLLAGERPMSPVAAQAIGYREVIAMLAGRATLAETIERIQARSRQFAKRQGTWFRGLEEVRAFPVEPDEEPEAIAERLGRWLD